MAKRAEERPSAREVEEVLTEMAAAVIPAAARPSTRLQAVALPKARASTEISAQASTLGRGVGQVAMAKSLRLRHYVLRQTERWAWLAERTSPMQRLAGIAGLAGVLSLGLLIGVGAGLWRLVAPTPAAAVVPSVHWTVRSVPAGAQVLRKQDLQVLGQTPWAHEQPSATGMLDVVLRLPGYKDRPLALDQSLDAQLDETLEALPPAAPAAADIVEPSRKGSRRSSKGSKEGGKRGSHGSRTKLID